MAKEVSPKMKKAIKSIELGLGIKYHGGKDFDLASKFISENIDAYSKVDMRDKLKPSAKMKKGIDFCEKILGVKFQGSTMKEASEFLDKYLQKTIDQVGSKPKKGGK